MNGIELSPQAAQQSWRGNLHEVVGNMNLSISTAAREIAQEP
ncbi:hypothetical protein FOZG_17289 [Fusarium oxysporum Fo47]|uniref:Uncharacterized protein n=1 Tax=Fusarium oxysporum Fo47 TaxID=660027 RepID=W9JH30_FUSOX|nr:hypothetical protein FOZG_17289 [Fusarium oxysporum Fo47]